jgi:type I restriction enzyme, S subunit
MIPEGWNIKALGSSKIAVIDGDRGAFYPNAHDFASEGYCLFLSAKNVTKSGFAFTECQFVSKSKHEQLRKGNVMPGDLVLTTRGTVGNVGYLRDMNGYGAIRINSGMVVIRNTGELVDTDYLYALFRAPIIERQIETMNFGSAQPQLTVKIINDLMLPLPPLHEQRRIAEILATWDRAVETVEALIANARAQKKALMQCLLTGKHRLQGFDGEWGRHAFREIAQLVKAKIDPRTLPDDVQGVELEHIEAETGRLVGTCQANEQVSLKTPFTPGNVLYGKLRPYLRKFSKPDFDGVCSTEIWVLAAKAQRCLPEFLHFLVQSPEFEGAVDVSSGSKMPRADWGIVSETVFATPSIQEQAAIAGLLTNADRMSERFESQLTALRQEKSALMQQLLTGKRRVMLTEREAA